MPHFNSAEDAYRWAYVVRERYRSGTAFHFDPVKDRGSAWKMYAVLDAIQIMILADRCDVVNGRGSFFRAWFVSTSEDLGDHRVFSERERWLLNRAIGEFEDALQQKGYLPQKIRG